MASTADLLALYDSQLRTDAETPSAVSVQRLGPLRLVAFAPGRGFFTCRHTTPEDGGVLARLAPEALAYFTADPDIADVEFKTRSHDHAPGLHETLLELGFTAGEPESIMIGPMAGLAGNGAPGVALRRIEQAADIEAMCRMIDEAFGEPYEPRTPGELLARLELRDGMELWVAEADGRMVGAARLEPVAGTSFAGLWGGGVLPEYRGRGVYSGLTAVRAASALAQGIEWAHSDCTEFSRPILERQGLVKVSETVPYEWVR